MPPAPGSVHKIVTEFPVSITQAIDAAQQATGGIAYAASSNAEDDAPAYHVMTASENEFRKIVIDGRTGTVTSDDVVPRFPGEPVEGEPTTTESGLMYYDINVGDGDQPEGTNAVVTVHYTGWLVDGTKFDSSVDRGQAASFPLNRVIPGWTEGVSTMKVGGKRKLIIPFELGYGDRGSPPVIPPKAMLIFDVELIKIGE
ncbi:MAG: FKBP-type peptidyl-prolyl cis-trans isomerase [Planctomycetes bacterium]|nr:FKBP-type peptidyl-prolyl cis-trans isomerase [Planctomycetota bacterium]